MKLYDKQRVIQQCVTLQISNLWTAFPLSNVVKGIKDGFPIFLIQNKTDLLSEQKEEFQTEEYLKKCAQKYNFARCYQISVKFNDKVDQIFQELVEEMIEKRYQNQMIIHNKEIFIKQKNQVSLKYNQNNRPTAKKNQCF
ncbi:unnamed protein product [Paramecium octaurelia]|nr:unnamed protein product [Paramecium octaurelia]